MTGLVMVGLDGSDKAARALSVALALAALADASVHLVRVVAVSERNMNRADLIGIDPAAAHGKLDVETQLATTARDLTSRSQRSVSWEVIAGSDVAGALIRVAERHEVGVVVMGTRAATSTGLVMLGSVADRVMRESPKPVVLVPPGAADLQGKRIELQRILVPLDGSALADRSIDFLLGLPHARDLEVVVVGVVHNSDDIAFVGERLQVAASRLQQLSVNAAPRVIVRGDAADAIAGAVREFLVDMIAMSTRGEGGLRRFLLGSVAEGVVRAAEVPVLLLTPKMLAETPLLASNNAER